MQRFKITGGRLSAKQSYFGGSTAAQLTSRCSRFGRSRACKRSGGVAATGAGKWSRWALRRHTGTFARGMAHMRAGSFSAGVGRLARSGAPGPFSDRGRREGGNGPDWALEWRECGMGSVGENSGVSACGPQSGFDAARARETLMPEGSRNVGAFPKPPGQGCQRCLGEIAHDPLAALALLGSRRRHSSGKVPCENGAQISMECGGCSNRRGEGEAGCQRLPKVAVGRALAESPTE
jgi:hypothetical protein